MLKLNSANISLTCDESQRIRNCVENGKLETENLVHVKEKHSSVNLCKMSSVEVRGAVKSYDGKNFILKGLNLTIQAGSIYGLIGASGCGKTTLLSCILGMKQLDAGTINVFGQKVSHAKASKFTNLIGYMPQETALVPELTIKETIYYFGNIFQMNAVALRKRFVMICDLLELKNVYKRIEQLSGGEKRRVSLAAVIIHDPQILILDEPTVGLDSILRNKIWTFLIDTTKSSKSSVIITTHYIAEAEKSNRCGLMRNGILLAEDSPQDIYKRFGVTNLDEVFLSLCISKDSKVSEFRKNSIIFEDTPENLSEKEKLEMNSKVRKENESIKFDERKRFSRQTLRALFLKEFIRIQRQPAEILFILIFPIIQIFCFAFAVGRNPIGLRIGIVNNEISDNSLCVNYLESSQYAFRGNSCYFENLSCYFLNEIEDTTAIKIFYNSFDEALKGAKTGEVDGMLTITSNFTDAISARKIDWQPINDVDPVDADQINVYMSMTNVRFISFLQQRLFKSFERFNKKVLRHCNLDDTLEDSNLKIETYYAKFDDDFTKTMMPNLIAEVIVLGSMLFSISSISQSRGEGIWNRTLLAGVTTSEILFVHILIFLIINVVEIVVYKIATMFLFHITFVGSQWLIGSFCLMLSMVGSSIGLFISIITKNVLIVNSAAMVLFFSGGIISGAYWPLQAQHPLIKYVAYTLPTTLPSISFRNIILKGFNVSHVSVYGGFSILFAWIAVMLFLCFVVLKKKKYSG